jgi:quercetin dioxygenase-like cupin family protein
MNHFKPGATFPSRGHEGGWESIHCLEGKIRFGAVVMEPGDTLYMQEPDEHDAEALEDTLIVVAHHNLP